MLLRKCMGDIPSDSETTVFQTFVAKLMSLQKHLHNIYHTDGFLRDRLILVVDFPATQTTLRNRMPCTSQKSVNSTANQSCDRPQSPGSTSVCNAIPVTAFCDICSNRGGLGGLGGPIFSRKALWRRRKAQKEHPWKQKSNKRTIPLNIPKGRRLRP